MMTASKTLPASAAIASAAKSRTVVAIRHHGIRVGRPIRDTFPPLAIANIRPPTATENRHERRVFSILSPPFHPCYPIIQV
jgi:hypothetical protein